MIRVNLKFIKTQVMPLLAQTRPDLLAFCNDRAHPHDYVRELLNIYFEKPTNNMRFSNLNISKSSLVGLESLRQQFEQHYITPQQVRSDASTMQPTPSQPFVPNYNPTTYNYPTTQPVQQPPAPVWDSVNNRWYIPEPAVIPVMQNLNQGISPSPPNPPQTNAIYPESDLIIEEDKEELLEEVKVMHMKDIEFDPNMFIPLETGTKLDSYISTTGGIMPATNTMVKGPAGSGKSSILIDFGWRVKLKNPEKKILFISGEMTDIDMKGLYDRFPNMGEIDILFMDDYYNRDTIEVVEEVINNGYDLVIMDSLTEIVETAAETCNITIRNAEKWLIKLFKKHNKQNNKLKLPTAFFFILQETKGGKFVGSNALNHASTAFLNIARNKAGMLYLEYDKNRRGVVKNALYFTHLINGIEYDFERYDADMKLQEILAKSDQETKDNWAEIVALQQTQRTDILREKHRLEGLKEATTGNYGSNADVGIEILNGVLEAKEQKEEAEIQDVEEVKEVETNQTDLIEVIAEVEAEAEELKEEIAKGDLSKLESKPKEEDEKTQEILDNLPFHESKEDADAAELRNAERETKRIAEEEAKKKVEGEETRKIEELAKKNAEELAKKKIAEEKEAIKKEPTIEDTELPKDNPNALDSDTVVIL